MKSERNPLTQHEDWIGLIRSTAAGDESSVAALYDATSPQVFGLVLRILGDRAAAEEVMLDVYTQVWRQAASYDAARGTPLGWLLTIARTRAIDRLRSSRRMEEGRQPIEAAEAARSTLASPEEATAAAERDRMVRDALASLGTEQRQIIELVFFSGLSHTEIAAATGLPLGTVKTRARLGMVKLAEMLRPLWNAEA